MQSLEECRVFKILISGLLGQWLFQGLSLCAVLFSPPLKESQLIGKQGKLAFLYRSGKTAPWFYFGEGLCACSAGACGAKLPNSAMLQGRQTGAAGNRSPAESHLTKPPAKTALLYQIPSPTDFDIFCLRFDGFLLLRFFRNDFAKPQNPFRKFPAQNANQPPRPSFKNSALGRNF